MSKYTPGPWSVGATLDNTKFISGIAETIVLGDPELVPRHERPHGRKRDLTMVEPRTLVCTTQANNSELALANARLIAAAPQMLEALKALTENIGNVGAHNCPGFDCNRCQNPAVGWALAHEAIEKAEGI